MTTSISASERLRELLLRAEDGGETPLPWTLHRSRWGSEYVTDANGAVIQRELTWADFGADQIEVLVTTLSALPEIIAIVEAAETVRDSATEDNPFIGYSIEALERHLAALDAKLAE